MRPRHRAALAAAALLCGPPAARAQPPEERSAVHLGARFEITPRELTAANPIDEIPHDENHPARYVRVHMKLEDGARGRWHLTIRDQQRRPVEVLTPADFAAAGPKRWSGRIPGNGARFDLRLADASAETMKVRIVFDQYIAMPEKAEHSYYSIQSTKPNYRPLFPIERFGGGAAGSPVSAEPDSFRRLLGDGVAFLMGSFGKDSWCCSGVVIGESLLLTNWHCGGPHQPLPAGVQWGPDVCADMLIDLSWDGDLTSREFGCGGVLAQDRERDYALLRLVPVAGVGRAWPLPIRTTMPEAGDKLFVIHHPECQPKQISSVGCSVVDKSYHAWVGDLTDVDLTHKCDTEAGSSGGAVLDAQGRLVALHHTGFKDSPDPVAAQRRLNTAVRLDRILEHLRSVKPEVVPELFLVP